MNKENKIDNGVITYPRVNINPINARITICPAVMFANKRIHKAKGFVNSPRNSTIIIIGITATGIPDGTSPLKYPANPLFLIPSICIIIKVTIASAAVTLMLPVGVDI